MMFAHRLAGGALAALLAASVVVAAASSANAAEATVELTSRGAAPKQVSGPPGLTVTIVNDDMDRHRLRARGPADVDTGNIDPGASAGVTLTVEGTYDFVDERTEDPADGLTVTITAPAPPRDSDEPDTTPDRGTTAPSDAEVSIPDRVFTPREVTIAVGGTVTWRNSDGAHTVTGRDGDFDSGVFDDGQSFSETFSSPGSFAYLCRLHPEMTGTVSVVGSGGAAPATDADQSAPPSSPSQPEAPQVPAPAPGPSAPVRVTGDGAGSADEVTVTIADFAFAPRELSVPAGSTVRWVNDGQAPHTVTSTTSGPLDSSMMAPGASYLQHLADPGVYEYLCTLHPEMTGRIEVTDAATALSGATSSPTPEPEQTTERDRSSETASDHDGPRVLAAEEAFDPHRLEVDVGTSVTWEMADDQSHTVTGDEFDSGILEPGATFTTTFAEAGTYTYACLVHPGMEGEVVVAALGDGSGPTASAPNVQAGAPTTRPARDESSGLPFAATVLLLGMVAAFATGRVTAPRQAT